MISMPGFFASGPVSRVEVADRRGSARTRLFTLVNAKGNREPMWAWDLGLGGLQCRAKTPRWPGTYLDLSFVLPGTNETIQAGSQVLSLDQLDDGALSLGLRFCMLSPRDQRSIYRFLDGRRRLWDKEAKPIEPAPAARSHLDHWLEAGERPFEGLLLEAEATMRARCLRQMGFVRGIRTDDLPLLTELSRGAF